MAESKWFIAILDVGVGLLSLVGVGQQEAFQLLFSANGILYALTYLVMFAIPLVGLRSVELRPPLWLRVAATSGFLMTLLFVVLSVFPIIEVKSRAAFTVKVSAVVIISNIVGAVIFLWAQKRRGAVSVDLRDSTAG